MLSRAGTCAEYSWAGAGICREDTTPLEPASLYGASKDALRRMQESLARQLNLSSAWGRIFFPYGPGEPSERLVPSVIRNIVWRATRPVQSWPADPRLHLCRRRGSEHSRCCWIARTQAQ